MSQVTNAQIASNLISLWQEELEMLQEDFAIATQENTDMPDTTPPNIISTVVHMLSVDTVNETCHGARHSCCPLASHSLQGGERSSRGVHLGMSGSGMCGCSPGSFAPPDNTTHPVKLDGTYGPNVPSNLTGMRKFPYHGYTTCIMAVSLYRAYHGTPQMCGGMKNTPNTFLDATCDKVTVKGRGACRWWLWYHAYHGWPYGLTAHPLSAAVHTLHTAGHERGGAWWAKYHAYHDMFPDVVVKLPRHQLPWVGTIGAAPLPPSETLKKYHAYLVRMHLQQKLHVGPN
ncbi:hypothetical protein C8J57DRAFT_1235775 [Mycena rebaudengoi]|nr:hypothetical protein C8J57DRAFT_1235775 [Mycena rebaudengoi]